MRKQTAGPQTINTFILLMPVEQGPEFQFSCYWIPASLSSANTGYPISFSLLGFQAGIQYFCSHCRGKLESDRLGKIRHKLNFTSSWHWWSFCSQHTNSARVVGALTIPLPLEWKPNVIFIQFGIWKSFQSQREDSGNVKAKCLVNLR